MTENKTFFVIEYDDKFGKRYNIYFKETPRDGRLHEKNKSTSILQIRDKNLDQLIDILNKIKKESNHG